MNAVSQIWRVCAYHFSRWKGNVLIGMTFSLAFVMCYLLTDKAVSFSTEYSLVLQVVEPFVWIFGDPESMLLSTLLLMLMFADMPFLNQSTPYYLLRTNRRNWLLGQLLYLTLATLVYLLFVLLCSCLLCAHVSYIDNAWSSAAAMLGYTNAGRELALPSMVSVMELTTPYECLLRIFSLMVMYSLSCVYMMLLCNLRFGRFWGVLVVCAFNLLGWLLTPEVFETLLKIDDPHYLYIANVAAGWLSPLNHATYSMHNFGYDLLPCFYHSYMIFIGILLGLSVWCRNVFRRYNFKFAGGEKS